MATSPDLVDWGIAARVAGVVAGTGPETTPAQRRRFRADIREFTTLSDELVGRFTGLEPKEPAPEAHVLDRAGWVRANIEGFRGLILPLTERLAGHAGGLGIGRRITSGALGLQVGVLLGYLGQKVLGQYDLLLASENGGGRVYFVGPNIVAAERRFGLNHRDFRLWIALHEITHRTQFTAVPWLRDKVHGLMTRSMGSLELDAATVRTIVERGRELLLKGPRAWKQTSLIDLLMPEEQKGLLHEMQALMTIVEGHGTFVMNRIGRERIASFDRMHRMFDARRSQVGGAERTFQRLIGMEMKYQQYTAGELFMEEVAARAGTDAVNRVWEREENLPRFDELSDPDRWLARVGG